MDSPCPVISLPAGLKERHPQPVSFGLEPTFIDPPSPGIHVDQQQWVAGIVDDAVNKALSRMEQLFSDQKAELEAKEAAAEKALKSRLKKEKKERAEERGDLVEAIREMALELGDRDNGNDDEPIVLKDAVGRKFIFPFETCRTWRVSLLHPSSPHIINPALPVLLRPPHPSLHARRHPRPPCPRRLLRHPLPPWHGNPALSLGRHHRARLGNQHAHVAFERWFPPQWPWCKH